MSWLERIGRTLSNWAGRHIISDDPYDTHRPAYANGGLPASVRRPRPPAGAEWRPVYDATLNAELDAHGIGLRHHEVIELWAPGWGKSVKILSLTVDDYLGTNAELMWRPVPCARPVWQWLN